MTTKNLIIFLVAILVLGAGLFFLVEGQKREGTSIPKEKNKSVTEIDSRNDNENCKPGSAPSNWVVATRDKGSVPTGFKEIRNDAYGFSTYVPLDWVVSKKGTRLLLQSADFREHIFNIEGHEPVVESGAQFSMPEF